MHVCKEACACVVCKDACAAWKPAMEPPQVHMEGEEGGEGWRPLVEDVSSPHASTRYMADKVDALDVLLVHPCARASKTSTSTRHEHQASSRQPLRTHQ